jgi:membrane fusion protein (multidrug efflux system)
MIRYSILLLASGLLFSCSGEKKENSTGAPKAKPLTVYGYVVQPDTLNVEITASATVLANEEVELHPEVSGKVTGIFFSEGEFVSKGKLLVKINDQELQAQLQRAKYVEELAQSDENRKKQLLEARGISREEYEIAQNKLNTTHAEIDLINAQIAKTEITAPFSGKTGLRNISEGAYVSPSAIVTTLQQTNPVKIDFSIPQKYISLVNPGTSVICTDEKGHEFTAVVYATDAKVDQSMRSIQVRARYANDGNKLIPGMFLEVKVVSEARPDALVIPAEALIPVMNGEKVYTSLNGVAIPHLVTSGYRTETKVEIREGLQPGDTVITTGILMLRDSAKVKVEKVLNR